MIKLAYKISENSTKFVKDFLMLFILIIWSKIFIVSNNIST